MAKTFLPNINACIVHQQASLREGLEAISKGGALLACVVDNDRKLVGILSDSDIRKALIRGRDIDDPATEIMKKDPVTAPADLSEKELLALASSEGVREIPLIDSQGRIQDIFVVMLFQERQEYNHSEVTELPGPELSNPVLILAGGKGTRLRSIVSDRPKPLAVVGGKPLLQTLIERARHCGFRRFFVSVNYLAEQIEVHLQSPQYSGLDITTIREEIFLGTAGCLGLVKEEWKSAMLVANGDVLTKVRFENVLVHHENHRADITCVLRPYEVAVPYGVVEVEAQKVVSLREKPVHHHLVNTGIYVLSPSIRELIRSGEVLDMPTLIQRAIAAGKQVTPFYMHEYWRDVGKPEDFRQANQEYSSIFGSTF